MRVLLLLLSMLVMAGPAWAQQELRGARKGASAPAPITGTSIDPDHTALDVYVRSSAGGGDGAILDGVSAAIKATVFNFTNSHPLGVVLRDTNGDYVSVGGGTQYNEGDPATATDIMTMAGCVRNDTAAVAAGVIDGDRARCIVDSTGRAWTHVGTIDGGTITSITNAVTVTDGSGAMNVIVDSGSITANAGTNLNTSALALDATLTGGTQKAIVRGGAKGSTTAADVTSTASGANHNILDVAIYDAAGNQITTFGGGSSTPADGFANPTTAGLSMSFVMGFNGTTWDRISDDNIGGNKYLKTSTIQDIEISASNSSTSNLAVGATFTGTSQTTLGVGSIQVNLFTDQNATIQVQQAQQDPGTNWDVVDSWTYTANSTGNDAARTIQATGSSVRVLVTNNGAATTTVLRLSTAMCPICDALPRGLTQLGNLKTALVEPLPSGTNIIGTVKIDPSADTYAYGSGFADKRTQRVELALNSQGQVRLAQGSQTIGSVMGTQSDNTFNSTQKIPTMPARANNVASLVTEGYQQPLSTTLFGAMRDSPTDPYGNPMGIPSNPITVKMQTASLFATPVSFGASTGLSNQSTTVAVLANQGALRGAMGAIQGDYGMVTHPSIAPALQCPFVKNISITASTQLVTNAGGQRIHVCAFSVVLAATESVSLVEGTGSTCATGTTGLYGGTSASAVFASNGGVAMISDRITIPMQVAGDNLCLLKSAANNVSGTLVYGLY